MGDSSMVVVNDIQQDCPTVDILLEVITLKLPSSQVSLGSGYIQWRVEVTAMEEAIEQLSDVIEVKKINERRWSLKHLGLKT